MGDEASEVRAPGRAAIWIIAAALVLLVGRWIPFPGTDTQLLAELGVDAGAALSAIGLSIGALVGVRLLLSAIGKSERGVARGLAFALYLLLTIVQALALAFWMESLNLQVPFADVVPEPGWRFRAVAVLSSAAGATVLWWLADRIDATHAATGALALALMAELLRVVSALGAVTEGLAIDPGQLAHGLALVLPLPVSMLALAIGLALRTPAGWPVTITGSLRLRSAFDVLAAPAAIATLAGTSIAGTSAPALVRAALVIAGAIGVAVMLRARVDTAAPRRVLWPAGVALAVFALVLAPVAISAVSSGVIARVFEPGPLEGGARFEVTLAAVDRFRDGEAEAMVGHLRELGADARIASADPQRITLRVEAARDTESVLEALRPHTLALHLAEDFPSVPLPEGISPPDSFTPAPEGPCDSLRTLQAGLACHSALERVIDEGLEVLPGEPTDCRLYCLQSSPVVTGADVTDAQIMSASYSGEPVVSVTLSESSAARFERLTGENIGRPLAIVFDGEIVSAPVIRDAIPGGQIQITLGARSYTELLNQANQLVSALTTSHRLTSEWTLESVQ